MNAYLVTLVRIEDKWLHFDFVLSNTYPHIRIFEHKCRNVCERANKVLLQICLIAFSWYNFKVQCLLTEGLELDVVHSEYTPIHLEQCFSSPTSPTRIGFRFHLIVALQRFSKRMYSCY